MKKKTMNPAQDAKSIFDLTVNLTIDKRLNDVKGGPQVDEMVAEANRQLSEMKPLPR
jgi:hypothetical protein